MMASIRGTISERLYIYIVHYNWTLWTSKGSNLAHGVTAHGAPMNRDSKQCAYYLYRLFVVRVHYKYVGSCKKESAKHESKS